jgi:WhiB family redox-sensing transcriptional regulator
VALRRDEQHSQGGHDPDGGYAWLEQAACRGEQSAVFFPPATFERKEVRLARERSAKAICRTCPVTEQCLDYALRTREPHGVWGGLNEVERRQLGG